MIGTVAASLIFSLQLAGVPAAQQPKINSTSDLEAALKTRRTPEINAAILGWLNADQLKVGIWPRVEGTKVAVGIRAPGAKEVEARLVPGGPIVRLTNVADDAFTAVIPLKLNDAYRIIYYADDKPIGEQKTVEIYKTPREMKPMRGVVGGTLVSMPKQTSKIYPDTQSEWWVYKPSKAQPEDGYGLIVFQDGQWARTYAVTCLDNLIALGQIPPVVAVFIKPSEYADGKSIRWRQYDFLSDEYVRFVLDEYLPVVEKSQNVKLSKDPMKRCIAGLSSGGICAFTAAWERPNEFGLVMSWIGSFVNIAAGESKREGGHNYPALIRKVPKKPIRVFLQDGDKDLDNEHGDWWLSNLQMVKSLNYMKYDYKWVPGPGFHSDNHGRSIMPDALRWLFAPAMGKS